MIYKYLRLILFGFTLFIVGAFGISGNIGTAQFAVGLTIMFLGVVILFYGLFNLLFKDRKKDNKND